MLFNSSLYGVFLLVAFAVFWTLRRRRIARALFLVLASYGFYFYGTYDAAQEEAVPFGAVGWSVLCLSIIFVGSTLDYFIARVLGRTEAPGKRKALLLVSIVYYLGVLSLFKYFNFAVDSFHDLFALFGVDIATTHLRLVLPFGISFFTFETMSYTIDVYRRELEPCDRYLDYLLFVCFFPHLVAGPIVRPRQMLPQLAREPAPDTDVQARGLWLIGVGLAKKIGIGDYLSLNLVGARVRQPGALLVARVPRRDLRLRDSDLLRLLGLHGRRHRERVPLRLRAPEELRRPLHGAEPPGVLAPLAHLALELVTVLSVHPAWGIARRGV